jgi:hypothetical protein
MKKKMQKGEEEAEAGSRRISSRLIVQAQSGDDMCVGGVGGMPAIGSVCWTVVDHVHACRRSWCSSDIFQALLPTSRTQTEPRRLAFRQARAKTGRLELGKGPTTSQPAATHAHAHTHVHSRTRFVSFCPQPAAPHARVRAHPSSLMPMLMFMCMRSPHIVRI